MTTTSEFLTALPERSVMEITGPDARSFLQRVITRGPEGVTSDTAQFSALLTPQGKILADFIVFDAGEGGIFLDVPTSEAASLLKRFTMYRLRAAAEIALRDDLQVASASTDSAPELQTVGLAVANDPRSSELGVRAIVPAGGPSDQVDFYHLCRIQLGIPEFGPDYAASDVFSTDVNHDLLGGIDYKKGCFVGQEVASRMHRKGGVRKRTLAIYASAGSLEVGEPIKAGEVEVGSLTSAAGSYGLALVRIDRLSKALESGANVTVGDVPVEVLTELSTL